MTPVHAPPKHAPYADDATNAIYNLLFCDDAAAFAKMTPPKSPLLPIFAKTFDERAVRALADSDGVESRLRVLAFKRLSAEGRDVPKGILLGTVIEVTLDEGMDTLGVYLDRRLRYINQTGQIGAVESLAPVLEARIAAVMATSRTIVERIGPWGGERLAPPAPGKVRMTFLVSDGLYFGEGVMENIVSDELAGPLLQAAGFLLSDTVDLLLSQQNN